MNKHWVYAVLVLACSAGPAAAACQNSDLAGRWQLVINFPGVPPGGSLANPPGYGYVLSCRLLLRPDGRVRADQSICIDFSFGFADAEEFTPGAGRLQVDQSCGVVGSWSEHQIRGTLGADKVSMIGVIEWSDGDIGSLIAVRPGR